MNIPLKKTFLVSVLVFGSVIPLSLSAATLTCTYGGGTGHCNLIEPLPSNCQRPPTAEPALEGQMICNNFPPNGYDCTTSGNTATCELKPQVNSSSQTSQAQPQGGNITYTPLEPLPGIDQSGQANFVSMVSTFFRLLLTLGAFIAVVTMVIGGSAIMLSEVPGARAVGRARITAGLIGLAILGAAWLGLRTINPQLVSFDSSLLSPFSSPTTGGASGGNGAGNAQISSITVTNPSGITVHDSLSESVKQKALQDFEVACKKKDPSMGIASSRGSDSGGPYTEYICKK